MFVMSYDPFVYVEGNYILFYYIGPLKTDTQFNLALYELFSLIVEKNNINNQIVVIKRIELNVGFIM